MTKVGASGSEALKWISGTMYATSALAGTETTLTLAFANPSATYVDSTGGGCPAGGEGPCIMCEPRLEIDVDLTLTTADGALDEKVRAKLVTRTADTATMTFDIDAAKVAGTYLTKVTPDSGMSLTGVHLEAAFGGSFPGSHATVPNVWNGFVAAMVKSASSVGNIYTSHGYFPPETGP
jgi:hypothetical protein